MSARMPPLRPWVPTFPELVEKLERLRTDFAARVADAACGCEREIARARTRLDEAERLVAEGRDADAAARALFGASMSVRAGGIRSAKLDAFWRELDVRGAVVRMQLAERRRAWETLVRLVGEEQADRAVDLAYEVGREEAARRRATDPRCDPVTEYLVLLAALVEQHEPLPAGAGELRAAMRRWREEELARRILADAAE